MDNSRKSAVKITYHFLCEACVVFLLFVPVMHYRYSFIPYWSYLIILSAVSLVIFWISIRSTCKVNIIYIVMLPVLFLLLGVSGVPVDLSAVLAIILTWRYISITRETVLEREMFYIKAAFLIAAIDIMTVKESLALLYTCFIFLFTIGGYITSQFISVDKISRQATAKRWKSVFYFPLLLLGPALLFLYARGDQLVFWLWNKVINGLVFIATLPLYLLQLADIDLKKFEVKDLKMPEDNGQRLLPEQDGTKLSAAEQATPYMKWFVMAMLLILLIILVIRILNRKHQANVTATWQEPVIRYEKRENDTNRTMKKFRDMLRHLPTKPRHPVRRMVLSFEKRMLEQSCGRKYDETIEDWLNRIGLNDQLETYQKVRYGENDVSKKEMNDLEKKLRILRQKIAKEDETWKK